MKIYYGGHSSFMIEKDGYSVLIDPFILSSDMESIKPDAICVTHGHGDHTGMAEDISKKHGAPIIAVFELANLFSRSGCKTIDGHIGGSVSLPFGRVSFVPALHGSSFHTGENAGNPCGFIIDIGGTKVYHAGDTGLFSDMSLIRELYNPDIFLCPIGDKYTMGVRAAVKAVDFVRPKAVIPMHYNTFPAINASPEEFKAGVDALNIGAETVILSPGGMFEY